MDANEGPQRAHSRKASSRRTATLLGLLLAASLGLRVWHALPGLDRHRFVDERYPLENIQGLLEEGRWRPVNGLHPGLSYLPHAGLLKVSDTAHRLTGVELFSVFDSRGDFTSTSYFLCRMLQVAFGVGSLWLVFLIGRRLGDENLGLLAALFLSTTPWHIRQSVVYKADSVLVFCVVLAFLLSLRAVDKPTWGRYSAAGGAIGMALAAKFNGGPIAIPLAVGTLLSSGFATAALLRLLLAGTISVAVFLAFDPYALIDPSLYRRSIARTVRLYERRGEAAGVTSRWQTIPDAAASFVSGGYFGRWIGTLGLLGLVSTLVGSLKRGYRSRSGIPWLMVASYPAAYLTLYAATTRRPDPHNWLPLAPFVALGAAWMLQRAWMGISDRIASEQLRRPATATALLILTVGAAWPAIRFVYFNTVPTTADLAVEFLFDRFRAPTGRLVVTESELEISPRYEYLKRRLAWARSSSVASTNPRSAEWTDGEILASGRPSMPGRGESALQAGAASDSRNLLYATPSLFHAHGPAMVAVAHPFRRAGRRLQGRWVRSSHDRSLYHARWEREISDRTLVSLDFELPGRRTSAEIRIESDWYPPAAYHPHGRRVVYTTPRFRAGHPVVLRLLGPRRPQQLPLTVKQWRKGRR